VMLTLWPVFPAFLPNLSCQTSIDIQFGRMGPKLPKASKCLCSPDFFRLTKFTAVKIC